MKPDESIIDFFYARTEEHPDKAAVIYLGSRFTYARFLKEARAFAGFLASKGINPGDRVMIYLPNCPQWISIWLGILMRGAVAVPLSPIYPARDLLFVARDSGASAIVCTNTNFGYVARILPRTEIKLVVHTCLTDPLPLWKKALALILDKTPRGQVMRGAGIVPYARTIGKKTLGHHFAQNQIYKPARKDLAAILYTGGTTKDPKGVPFTHDLFLQPIKTQLEIVSSVIPKGENIILLAAPLFHITGLTFGLGALCHFGETVILLPRLNPDGLMDAMTREGARSLFGVPALYRLLLEHDRLDDYDFSSLVYCFSGGDVLAGRVGQRWFERFKTAIGQGYGATETNGGVALTVPNRKAPPNSVGVPVKDKHIRLVDPVTLDTVPSGRTGELLVSSDPMIEEYWRRPEETTAAFVHLDGRKWYRTGDIMRQDAEGHLYFVDRVSDAILHMGEPVSVSEIETALQEHPAVTGACVVGVPDETVGERIKAFVVLKDNRKGLSGRELMDWLSRTLPPRMVPQYIEFRDTLPKSKVGKLLRRQLRIEEKERLQNRDGDEGWDRVPKN